MTNTSAPKGKTAATSTSKPVARSDRRLKLQLQADQRGEFERDRDRILYCSAFKRLAGVTQVVGPSEGHVFHSRLTHTLKVAQLARRLAQKLISQQGRLAALANLDPEVAEAAALAHDLGHPPFGHVAESELDSLVSKTEKDGFEGNAQSFRVVTKLAVRDPNKQGLDLTRATLNSILKYPWLRERQAGRKHTKFGAYRTEREDFSFARTGFSTDRRCLEAELMDISDDIAYCVHDVEDFYRAGFVPLDRLLTDSNAVADFIGPTLERLTMRGEITPSQHRYYQRTFDELMRLLWVLTRECRRPFDWATSQRAELRNLTSELVKRYVSDVALDEELRLKPFRKAYAAERRLLKQLIWHYVILNPNLATQQKGEKSIIRRVFTTLSDAAVQDELAIFPKPAQEELRRVRKESSSTSANRRAETRVIADLIAGMTEQQIIQFDQRLNGTALGSINDRL